VTKVSDVLYSVFPSDLATGVTLTDTIRITFTLEIDENSLEHGGIILEGPDTDEVIHNVYLPQTLVDGEEDRILESPGYFGVVPGTYTFIRLDPALDEVADISDTTGAGNLYRTRVVFTPDKPLAPDTQYSLYLVGDEDLTDGTDYGIKPRTVFDGVPDGGNTGTGAVYFSGSYTGDLISDTLNIQITKAGTAGTAEYEWWLDSAILDLNGPALSSIGTLAVTNGVNIRFAAEGMYNLGDQFTVLVKKQASLETTLLSSFTTGGGSIEAVPTTSATSPLGDPIVEAPSVGTFAVKSISPANLSTDLVPDKYQRITVEFTDILDPLTVTQDSVTITAEPVTDHPNLDILSPNGEIAKTITTSGRFLYVDL
jgi:hypothetical protein